MRSRTASPTASAGAGASAATSTALTIPPFRGRPRSASDASQGGRPTALVTRAAASAQQLAAPQMPALPLGTTVTTLNVVTVQPGGTYIAENHEAPTAAEPKRDKKRPPLYSCIINSATGWLVICSSLIRFNYYEDRQFIKLALTYLVDQNILPAFVKIGGIGMETEGLGDFAAWSILWLMIMTCTYSALKNFIFGISSYLSVRKSK